MRDPHLPSSGPDGPASPHPAPQPAGQRSGEGSDSVLEHMRKDTFRKIENGGSRRPSSPRNDPNAQAAR